MVWTVYAALLAVLYVVLSVRTLRLRRALQIALGDGGDERLLRSIRAHANFAEYVPLGLLLMVGVETTAGGRVVVHILGCILLAGRLLHAYGVSRAPEVFMFRVSGMALTFTVYLTAAIAIVYGAATVG